MQSEIARLAAQLYQLRTSGSTTTPIPRASARIDAFITRRQQALNRGPLRVARWWELEALRGYESSWRSAGYAQGLRQRTASGSPS